MTDRLPDPDGRLDVEAYLGFIATEYLGDYVSAGGAAVKLVVTDDLETAKRFGYGFEKITGDFVHVAIDAASTRVHLVDQLFATIARQLDWMGLADDVVARAYERAGFPAAGGYVVADVAARYRADPTELYRSVRRALEGLVLDDTTLTREFRVAMFRLCQSVLEYGDIGDAERDAVLGWLRGETIPAARLRPLLLHGRIARHNARPLLVSLTRWVRRAGRPGLAARLDLTRIAVSRRPLVDDREGFYYTKAAALDTYELLRHLVDATDEFAGLLMAVILPVELLSDTSRGLPAYSALQLRVADEVRDRRRVNPYAAMVRLAQTGEAIA